MKRLKVATCVHATKYGIRLAAVSNPVKRDKPHICGAHDALSEVVKAVVCGGHMSVMASLSQLSIGAHLNVKQKATYDYIYLPT